jgi:hypothetical protein
LSIFATFCDLAQAQPQRPNGRRAGSGSGAGPGRHPPGPTIRERWLSLPPAERQIFQRNAERWMRMSPQERQIMRERENLRRERIRHETEAALRDSGLLLDQQKRDLFESRYMQERRKVEQALRQQTEAERQQQLPALIQQLKKEFQSQQSNGSTTAKPAESPKSGKRESPPKDR